MSQRENIARIKAVYHALEELSSDTIFVGGATVSLYSQRPRRGCWSLTNIGKSYSNLIGSGAPHSLRR